MKLVRMIVPALAALLMLAAASAPKPPVGYDALADIDRVWQYTGAVRTAMSSSTAPDLGNLDMSNFHGKFRGEPVLARLDGPGCIYRIWSAAPSGIIKVYLDGAARPEIACGFKSYLEGKCPGLPDDFALGRWANYMPIPFAKSIVITAPGFVFPGYYQVSYQTYDIGTPVESFRRAEARKARGYTAAAQAWRDGVMPAGRNYEAEMTHDTIAPHSTVEFIAINEPGVFRSLQIKNSADPKDPLASLELRIYFDAASEPQVVAPVDAFFVNRFDLKSNWPGGKLASMFISAGVDGYRSFFPMPFGRGARLTLENTGDAPVMVDVAAWYEPLPALPAGAMIFHAEYREKDYETDRDPKRTIDTHTAIDPATNYVTAEVSGAGHYLGSVIFVESVGTQWWGEGDEWTWVDGAKEPQILGTGTEDEFNWSWGFTTYQSPVSGTLPVIPECKETIAAQVVPSLRNPECMDISGHNIAYRFRPTDYVAFSKSIKVSYEVLGSSMTPVNSPVKGNWSQWRGDDYSSMAYWYQLP